MKSRMLTIIVMMLVLPLASLTPQTEAAAGGVVTTGPSGDNIFRQFSSSINFTSQADNTTGTNPSADGGVNWQNPPQDGVLDCHGSTTSVACVALRYGTYGPTWTAGTSETGANPAAAEHALFWELEGTHNATAAANHTAFRANLGQDVPFTEARFEFSVLHQDGGAGGGGQINWWMIATNNAGDEVWSITSSTLCSGTSRHTLVYMNHTLLPRIEARNFTLFADKTNCVLPGAASTQAEWKLAAAWSTDPNDANTYSTPQRHYGDFMAFQEGAVSTGETGFPQIASNITVSVPGSTTLWGFYAVGCVSQFAFQSVCNARGSSGPASIYNSESSNACLAHTWQGFAGTGSTYVSMWKHTNTCNTAQVFRAGGIATGLMRYFVNHDVYLGTSFPVAGGDFRTTGTRPIVAECWACPGAPTVFRDIALLYREDQSSLGTSPSLTAGMTTGVNTDFANAQTASLSLTTKAPLTVSFEVARNTYWGNALMYALTIRNTTAAPATSTCNANTVPVLVNGNSAEPFARRTWQEGGSGSFFVSCFYLLDDLARTEGPGNASFDNGRAGSSRLFTITHTSFPDDWENEANGAGYTLQALQNFRQNHSEFLGCSTAAQASYCFGRFDTTGFSIPGLSSQVKFTICTAEGTASFTPVGDGTFTANVTAGPLQNVDIFEATSGIANTTTNQSTLPTNIENACIGQNDAIPAANISVAVSSASTIHRFTFTRAGFHTSFANFTGATDENYVILVVMNRTTGRFHFQEACSTINTTIVFCRVLPSTNPGINCDLFNLASNTCFTLGLGTPSGLIRRWVFQCPTEAGGEIIGSVAIHDAISGVVITTSEVETTFKFLPTWEETTKTLLEWLLNPSLSFGKYVVNNTIIPENKCAPSGTPLIQTSSPQLKFSKPGYRTIMFNTTVTDDDAVIYAQMFQGTGESTAELVTTTRTTINDPTFSGGKLRNVTAIFIRDTNTTTNTSVILPGLTSPGLQTPSENIIFNLANTLGFAHTKTGRALFGFLFLFAPMVLGFVAAHMALTGRQPPTILYPIVSMVAFLIVLILGFWPVEVVILVMLISIAAVIVVFKPVLPFTRGEV